MIFLRCFSGLTQSHPLSNDNQRVLPKTLLFLSLISQSQLLQIGHACYLLIEGNLSGYDSVARFSK